jgi:hypothetical protein
VKLLGPHVAGVGDHPGNPWALQQQNGMIKAVKNDADPSLINALNIYTHHDYVMSYEKGAAMNKAYWDGGASVPEAWVWWFNPANDAPGIKNDAKQSWVSEVSGESPNWLNGANGTPGDGAILIAKRIHDSLVHGNTNAYIYWQLADGGDSPSIHTLLGRSQLANPLSSKKYCAFRHFSRFIRPGAARVNTTPSSLGGVNQLDTNNSFNISAYKNPDGKLTVVAVNMRAWSEPVSLGGLNGISHFAAYRTSNSENFVTLNNVAVSNGTASLNVPAYSVVTLAGAATTPTPIAVPNAPSGLNGTAVSRTRINLRWTDNSDNESGFVMQRSLDGSTWSQIATLAANTTTYANTKLSRNRLYYYRVYAFNNNGNSSFSNTASTRTFK